MLKIAPQTPPHEEDELNGFFFEPEEYEETLLNFENPEVLYRLSREDKNENENENDLDTLNHPYREDLAYINDLEALTATDEGPDDPETKDNTRE